MFNRCDGYVNVLAKHACNQKGHRRCAFVKRKEGHMVADIGQYAILRERQETDYKDLQEIIEHMSTGELLATMERKQKLNSE